MGLTTQTYDILTRLAVGNGALVYRALDKVTHRQVALKLLVQEGDLDHRFNVEALLADSPRLRQITGAHVCQLLDAYKDEDGPVLVYEYANGISGAEFPSQRKLDATQAVDVAAQLISALRSGERQKCPHGDVKPSNIVFIDLPDKRPFTIILDWGLTAYRTAMADDSLQFLAPERLAGGPASHRADLFSAGAALVYLYSGKMLVAGTDRVELQAAWQKSRPAALAELRPDLPAKLVQWVCSLLELTPEKRPESAVEALASLAALSPPPPPIPPEAFRPRPTPPASSLPKPPPLKLTKPASEIQKAPPTPGTEPGATPGAAPSTTPDAASASTPAKTVPKPATAPVKKSHIAMTIGLFTLFVAMVAGSVWFVFFRKMEPAYLTEGIAEKARPTVAARTPAPSVGAAIGKKYTPPPLASPANPQKATPRPTKKPAPKPAASGAKPSTPFIACDAFEYPGQRPIDGTNGGDGWAGPWTGPLATVEGASLGMPQIQASGASLVIPATEQEVSISRPLGPLEKFTDPAKGGTWYFACLLQHGSDLPTPGGDIQINPFNGTDVHDLVRIVASDVGGALQLTLNNQKDPLEVKDTSKPVLVVLRTTLQNPKFGKWDLVAELFVNPVIGSQWPPPGSRKIEVKLSSVRLPEQPGLLLRKPRAEATTRIDEIRFAQRFPDLAYRPSPGAKPPAADANK